MDPQDLVLGSSDMSQLLTSDEPLLTSGGQLVALQAPNMAINTPFNTIESSSYSCSSSQVANLGSISRSVEHGGYSHASSSSPFGFALDESNYYAMQGTRNPDQLPNEQLGYASVEGQLHTWSLSSLPTWQLQRSPSASPGPSPTAKPRVPCPSAPGHDKCHRTFSRKQDAMRHAKTEEQNAAGRCDYPCGKCDKQFNRNDKLKEHFSKVHEETA